MIIYKILRADEWAYLRDNGKSKGAPIDIKDGYIHFSTAETVVETAIKYFKNEDRPKSSRAPAPGLVAVRSATTVSGWSS